MLAWYTARWAIEVSFHYTKQHLGFEQPQGWTRRAAERTAPITVRLYSLIVLWFAEVGHYQPTRPIAPGIPTSRTLRSPTRSRRVQSVREQILQTPPPGPEGQKFLNTLIQVYQQAA